MLLGGPVVGLVIVTDHWQYYINGTMRAKQCEDSSVDPNHAVLIVGYDFSDPDNSYYIIKNTWDVDWGYSGYFRLEAGADACGIGEFLSFACTAGDCPTGVLDRAKRKLRQLGTETL